MKRTILNLSLTAIVAAACAGGPQRAKFVVPYSNFEGPIDGKRTHLIIDTDSRSFSPSYSLTIWDGNKRTDLFVNNPYGDVNSFTVDPDTSRTDDTILTGSSLNPVDTEAISLASNLFRTTVNGIRAYRSEEQTRRLDGRKMNREQVLEAIKQ